VPAARTLPAALAALLVAAGCGSGAGAGAPATPSGDAKPVGDETAGSVVQFADCGDWRAGSRAERQATVVALRGQLTPQRSANAASPLDDTRAYAMLDRACTPAYAESMRLYKLYVRMQGFAPLAGD
jgi:hypothetical protein